eukprot:TRINITY_DN33443_c0_g1_i1.p1 TRINITY_DN33443_c0_g1~~TRINITY_DN33443_c0_g1_i1.p1  ORF type:complete len:218 (-),score=43.76 TRINITY_DN33443_c0_g1_i1:271-924(-)
MPVHETFVIQYVLHREPDEEPIESQGLKLVFNGSCADGGVNCHVAEIVQDGLTERKNEQLAAAPELEHTQLRLNDFVRAVNGERSKEAISVQLKTSADIHMLIHRVPAVPPPAPTETNGHSHSHVACADIEVGSDVGQTQAVFDVGGRFEALEAYDAEREPNPGYLTLMPGELVQVWAGSRQAGDKTNCYPEYVYGERCGRVAEQGWMPVSVLAAMQ